MAQVEATLALCSSDEPVGAFDTPVLHVRQGEALRRLYSDYGMD